MSLPPIIAIESEAVKPRFSLVTNPLHGPDLFPRQRGDRRNPRHRCRDPAREVCRGPKSPLWEETLSATWVDCRFGRRRSGANRRLESPPTAWNPRTRSTKWEVSAMPSPRYMLATLVLALGFANTDRRGKRRLAHTGSPARSTGPCGATPARRSGSTTGPAAGRRT